ncbi:hypothetical protein AAK964_12205 [Tissierella praeacuta]|uniref:hypothetical protein n=1 Tax=Tissierella praeacuta TaxID=43131 RepID=UPI0035142A85
MKEMIQRIKDINDYYESDYKIIKKYLTDRYLHTQSNIFQEELLMLNDELINKKTSHIDILNIFYSTYMRSKISFDNFKTLEEKQYNMQYGQLTYYVERFIKDEIVLDLIEIDKNIVRKGNVYYLKDTEIKLFEDVETENGDIYYYVCNLDIALDTNNIQKIFSNEIMNLDYLSNAHYNNNKIFFFREKQDGNYNLKVNLSDYKIYKRTYFIDTGFKEIYYIKESELDIDNIIHIEPDVIESEKIANKIRKEAMDTMKHKAKDMTVNFEEYDTLFEELQNHVDLESHLQATNKDYEKYESYILIKENEDDWRKIYKSNDYTRYFHGTSLRSAKKIIREGYRSNNILIGFDFNKLFFTPDIKYSKVYSFLGGVLSRYSIMENKSVIFECNLDDYEDNLYHYIHNFEYFIYSKAVKPDIIKRIWLVEEGVITREITREELLNMGSVDID